MARGAGTHLLSGRRREILVDLKAYTPFVTQGASRTTSSLASCDPAAPATSSESSAQTEAYVGQAPPSVGAWIYMPTRMSISHGHDDVAGGRAQVTKVVPTTCNGGDHWIHVAQHSRTFSWRDIARQQKQLQSLYGVTLARADLDYGDPGPDDDWVPVPGAGGRGGWQSLPGRGFWP